MSDVRPVLVLVSGAPGSGKTTLAARLATDLRLPLLTKDAIKEALLDAVAAPDRARSRELGAAAFAVLYAVVGRLLDADVGAVAEGNFRRGSSEEDLRPLAARARTRLVHCETGPEATIRRYAERAARGERHPGHHDGAALADLRRDLDAGIYAPLELGVPTLRVDTTAGYAPDLEAILAFAVGAGRLG